MSMKVPAIYPLNMHRPCRRKMQLMENYTYRYNWGNTDRASAPQGETVKCQYSSAIDPSIQNNLGRDRCTKRGNAACTTDDQTWCCYMRPDGSGAETATCRPPVKNKKATTKDSPKDLIKRATNLGIDSDQIKAASSTANPQVDLINLINDHLKANSCPPLPGTTDSGLAVGMGHQPLCELNNVSIDPRGSDGDNKPGYDDTDGRDKKACYRLTQMMSGSPYECEQVGNQPECAMQGCTDNFAGGTGPCFMGNQCNDTPYMWKDGKLVQITGKALTDIKQHMENHGGQTGSDPSLPQCNAQSQNGMTRKSNNQCTDEIVNSKYNGSKIDCCAQLSNKLGTGKCAFGCVDDNGGECVPCEGIVLGARRARRAGAPKKAKKTKEKAPLAMRHKKVSRRHKPNKPKKAKKTKKTEAAEKPTKKTQTPKTETGGTTAKDTGSHTSWVLKALGIFSVALVLAIIVAVIMRHYCNSKRLMYAAR
jgi:hypothetical protein